MMKVYDAIIIGTGAAGYSVADWLYKENVKNIAILSENRFSGTSRNTGSDKQTYYKLSLDGQTLDSPYKMAKDICEGGCTDGEKAYLQSLYSRDCFMRLYDYGVLFPRDAFGGFPGYKTDHDNTERATSVGPLTSKKMTECLEKKVLEYNKTPIFDNMQVVEILTCNRCAIGVVALNIQNNSYEIFCGKNIICATGAPACVYEKSVYPRSQHGMTGVLLKAGVSLCNFSQWQYGMASVDFRWNVSGSFMQVVPRFVSVDENGTEREFLPDYFDTSAEAYSNVFLKGYQWPFSADRINKSSRVDIAVHEETKKGRKVYLDYTQNPKGFDFEELCDEAKKYLVKNASMGETPFERLKKLNSKAIDVYARQNIDISKEYLQIAVCAQHNNGGVYTDNNYETDVERLYVIGEAAGTFGLTRPGGTALNDTQVGGLLCAKHIKAKKQDYNYEKQLEQAQERYRNIALQFEQCDAVDYSFIPFKMSNYAGFIRDEDKCKELLCEIEQALEKLPFKHKSPSRYYYDLDMLLSAEALLKTILGEMSVTGSRGGALFIENGNAVQENSRYREYLTITNKDGISFVKTKPVPVINRPFEQYLSEISE